MMVSLKREREDDVDDDDNEETGKCMLIYVFFNVWLAGS